MPRRANCALCRTARWWLIRFLPSRLIRKASAVSLGIALDPQFASNGFIYCYYTATTPATHNRVSRFTADPNNPNKVLDSSEVQ